MNPDLSRLIALQEVDTQLQQLLEKQAALPRQEAETASRLRRAREAVTAQQELLRRMTLDRREGEKEIESLADQERKFQGRTVDVKTNEELWALQKEIGGVQGKRSALETSVLEAMEREDAERAKLVPLQTEVAEAEARHAADRERVAGELKALAGQIAEVRAERERRVVELPDNLRLRYERVLTGGRRPAVVPLSKNACGGCYTAQPPQRVQEVRHGELVVVCEFCGRLLVGVAEDPMGPPALG